MNDYKKYFWLALGVIFILTVFFRFYNLATVPPGLYPDEAMNGNNALEAIKTGKFKVFYPENNGREGLFINFQALLLKIFQKREPWVLRSASALFGSLTVIGIFFLIVEILKINSWEKNKSFLLLPFLSSFLVAISFWHINFSRIGFRAIMAPAFLVWSIYFLIKSFNREKETRERIINPFLLAGLAGFLYGLGMHSYIAYRVTPLLIISIYFLYWKFNPESISKKRIFLNFLTFTIFALIAFAPLGIYFLKNPADFFGRTGQLSIFSSPTPLKDLIENTLKTLAMFHFKGDANWRHNYSGSPQLFWLTGLFFVLGILKGIAWVIDKKTKEVTRDNQKNNLKFIFLLSLIWLILAFLPVVISNEGIPHALRSILMIPPVFIISGIGGFYFFEFIYRKTNKKITYLVGIILMLAMILQSFIFYFILWAKNPNVADAFSVRYLEIGRQINEISEKVKKYVVVNASGIEVRGIPMPAQIIMFITDSFSFEDQEKKQIFYISPEKEKEVDENNSLIFYLEEKRD
ncbi:MAG: hypothetical protein KatS3mg098_413 [Candidatus Parcubacteria bacterium]|nr:MAG: hypothetical protein KatS3mg098_413 [Candidatus Parcubacteria bacterium]